MIDLRIEIWDLRGIETVRQETSDNQISGYNRERIKYKRKKRVYS